MNRYAAGFLSGFIATLILSLLTLLKIHMGLLSGLHIIQKINYAEGSSHAFWGWLLNVLFGTFVWGGLFVLFSPNLKGRYWLKGIYFGVIAWLLMMLGMMPFVQYGIFPFTIDFQVMLIALGWYVIYGFLLGFIYHMLPVRVEA